MKLPPNLTLEILLKAVERSMAENDNLGFCISCGTEAQGCEPDVSKLPCEKCGSLAVYGAEQILIEVGV